MECKTWIFFRPERASNEEKYECEEKEFRVFAEKGFNDYFFVRVEAPLKNGVDAFVKELVDMINKNDWTLDFIINIINLVKELYGDNVFEEGFHYWKSSSSESIDVFVEWGEIDD